MQVCMLRRHSKIKGPVAALICQCSCAIRCIQALLPFATRLPQGSKPAYAYLVFKLWLNNCPGMLHAKQAYLPAVSDVLLSSVGQQSS
jgi:hypothetical protein